MTLPHAEPASSLPHRHKARATLPAKFPAELPDLASLSGSLGALFADSAHGVAAALRAVLPDDATLIGLLPEADRAGRAEGYTRHLIHADPMARFSAMLLVWRPGQASPVHGHRTWCAYRVLQGTLHERHYRWDAAARVARLSGGVQREAGEVFSVPAGLGHIHALGNHGDAVAISLHVYGVEADRIASGVNLPVDAD